MEALLLTYALPFIVALIKSKIVPAVKRKAYEQLDKFANARIESLVELKKKIEITEDTDKKLRHMEGFRLGVEALNAIGKKLVKASEILLEE